MTCAECEDLIVQQQSLALEVPSQRQLDQHLAACSACRAFADHAAALDAQLAQRLAAPCLPPGFKAALLDQLDRVRTYPTPEMISRRRSLLNATCQHDRRRIWQCVLRQRWACLVDGLGFLGLALAGAGLIIKLAQAFPTLHQWLATVLDPNRALWANLIAALAFVSFGVWLGRPSRVRRLTRAQ